MIIVGNKVLLLENILDSLFIYHLENVAFTLWWDGESS